MKKVNVTANNTVVVIPDVPSIPQKVTNIAEDQSPQTSTPLFTTNNNARCQNHCISANHHFCTSSVNSEYGQCCVTRENCTKNNEKYCSFLTISEGLKRWACPSSKEFCGPDTVVVAEDFR